MRLLHNHDSNVGGKLVLPSWFTKAKNSAQNTNYPSRADACAGFWLNTEHGFRAGNAAVPFLVEEYKASGSNADRGLLQLIACMIVAYVGMRREIGVKLSVVYGSLQIGTHLTVYRLFSAVPTEKEVPKAEAPYILQEVGEFDLRDPEAYLSSLQIYYALYQQAEICLFELLDSLIQNGRKSVEPNEIPKVAPKDEPDKEGKMKPSNLIVELEEDTDRPDKDTKDAKPKPSKSERGSASQSSTPRQSGAKPRKTKSASTTNKPPVQQVTQQKVQTIDLKDCKIEDYFLLGEQLHEVMFSCS